MNKGFSLKEASRILRETKEAGIATQINIMFGLPTETKDDFSQTMEFFRRNRRYVDTVLASQSFCVIDKGTYIYDHPREFGVRNCEHHLFWESNNGENNYPERMRRYEEFCRTALSMGIPETSGVLRAKPDKERLLDDYHRYSSKVRTSPAVKVGPDDYKLMSSRKLADALKGYADTAYKGVELENIFSDFGFDEKQRSMCHALYSHGLWIKLSNYILADVQKARKEELLFGYPYWLVIDPCNYCSLNCPFCPTGQKRNVRTKAKLSLAGFKSVIDKLGPYLIHVDLVNWGEPFLNEDVFEMIKYAKLFGADVKVDTNMNHLDEKGIERLVLSGLDKIVVSIDGLSQETYAKYRVGGNFSLAMGNLKSLIKKREQLKSAKPYITWQFLVFRHNEHEVEEAIKLGRQIGVDHVGVTKAFIGEKDWIPRKSKYSNYDLEKMRGELTYNHFKQDQKHLFCSWPWEAVAVNSDLRVSSCCSVEEEKDDFGNFSKQPFEELWNGDKYLEARRFIRDRKKSPGSRNVCVGCRHLGMINIDILSCHSFFDTLAPV